ncbi:class Ib ribonucleoside-diphosphate reductase assembly flavoprotein NrdI [Sporosarcina globispora]|nr:class Ib ribonucleoside-diphosphate reductase assembly flavoprotein NrdI [Sporosarcina globispora]
MIVYKSRTGNVASIVSKLNLPNVEIREGLIVDNPYFLITYTDGLGDVPKVVEDFLKDETNQLNLKGVIASGNVNFGLYFCKAADLICENTGVPIIRKIDLRGTKEDIETIKKQYNLEVMSK